MRSAVRFFLCFFLGGGRNGNGFIVDTEYAPAPITVLVSRSGSSSLSELVER